MQENYWLELDRLKVGIETLKLCLEDFPDKESFKQAYDFKDINSNKKIMAVEGSFCFIENLCAEITKDIWITNVDSSYISAKETYTNLARRPDKKITNSQKKLLITNRKFRNNITHGRVQLDIEMFYLHLKENIRKNEIEQEYVILLGMKNIMLQFDLLN